MRDGKKIPRKDSERFGIYWLKNREGNFFWSYGVAAWLLSAVAVVGWLSLAFAELPKIVLPHDFVHAVRQDSWEFLNSNIGAYSFAGTILALIGFSAFQWWQTLEAKKELMIQAGVIAEERAQVSRRQYDQTSRTVRNTKLTLPSRWVYWLFASEPVVIPGFEALQARLLELAAPPYDVAPEKRQREIRNFLNVRDPLVLATLLKRDGQLRQHQYDALEKLLQHAAKDEISEATEITRQLFDELSTPDPQEVTSD